MVAHVPGIDVARYQGAPDWAAVQAAGTRFVYIKATEGVGYVSPTLDEQLAGARGAGMVTGLYHHARPDTNDPESDAADFAVQLARLDSGRVGNLPPCLDLECAGTDLPGWATGFVRAVRAHTGRHDVMVRASASWLAERLRPDDWIDPEVFLWVAHHGAPPGRPGYLSDRVGIHQHTSDGRVAGIDVETGLDVALMDLPVLTGAPAFTGGPVPEGDPSGSVGADAGHRPGSYVVQPGDTLSGIGARLGIDWHEIARMNGVDDPELIYVGEVLRVPR